MDFKSKKVSLGILAVTAIICSRLWFFLINDPEGPNLLIVLGLALALFFLSLAVYAFAPAEMKGLKKLPAAIVVQILAVFMLYFLMR